jgi:hypothetical protein
LPLPAAELMWEQPRHLPLKPDQFEYFRHALVELLTRGAGKRDAPRNRRLCCDQPLHCFQTFTGGRSGLLGADGLFFRGVSFCYDRASARYAAAERNCGGKGSACRVQ